MVAVGALAVVGCVATPSPSATTAPTEPLRSASPDGPCLPREVTGTYERTLTPDQAPGFDLAGTWRIELTDCAYEVTLDELGQGAGRIELTEGDARSGRLALSEDNGCPNEFVGTGLYDFSVSGDTITFEEAFAGVDGCEGRAEALVGEPSWRRQ